MDGVWWVADFVSGILALAVLATGAIFEMAYACTRTLACSLARSHVQDDGDDDGEYCF